MAVTKSDRKNYILTVIAMTVAGLAIAGIASAQTVSVYNGTWTSGAAATNAYELRNSGVQVDAVKNASKRGYETTKVVCDGEFLMDFYPAAEYEYSPEWCYVILGSDYAEGGIAAVTETDGVSVAVHNAAYVTEGIMWWSDVIDGGESTTAWWADSIESRGHTVSNVGLHTRYLKRTVVYGRDRLICDMVPNADCRIRADYDYEVFVGLDHNMSSKLWHGYAPSELASGTVPPNVAWK